MDISTGEEMVSALKPVKDGAHIVSVDYTPTLSVTAPLYAQLQHDTKKYGIAAETPVIQEIKWAIN